MKETKKGIGDKRTKECKRCYNTSKWVCFKCKQKKGVKLGYWIEPTNDDGTSEIIEYQVRCSECGLVLDPQTYSELKINNGINYCCRCGAKMKGFK